jgi:hypothetical protein
MANKATDEPLTFDNILKEDQADKIRATFRRGRKDILIDGRKFSITKRTKRVSFLEGGEPKHQIENWLIIKPADGSMLPTAQIELTDQGNSRSYKKKGTKKS